MEREISCINCKAILDYFEENSESECSDLIRRLDPEIDVQPDPEKYLRDTNNWVSCEVVAKLWERLRWHLGNERVAYDVARYAVERTIFGYAQKIIVKVFWSYKQALKHAQKINDKLNRSKRIEIVEIKRNQAIVRLYWNQDMGVSRDMCIYNQGAYAYMPLIWGSKPLSLREERCNFEGAPYCEYHLKWPTRNWFHEVFSRFFTSKTVLMETVKEMEEGKRVIQQKYEEVNRLNRALNRKIGQLLAIQDTGKAILSVLDLEALLAVIMNLLSGVCQINRALIMLVNEEAEILEPISSVGFDGDFSEEIKEYKVPLNRVSNILARVVSTGQPEYVAETQNPALWRGPLLTAGKGTSVYAVPLITRSKVIGLIATDAINGGGVPRETRETLEVFAPQIAIAIENARLYSRLKAQVSELKRSHSLLSRAEKLSFLGNLAARLAHEIKNPMTAIGTFIQMLPQKFDDEEFRSGFYEVAMEEIARVNNLISGLLDLAGTKESHFELNDLHRLIEKMILLISPESNAKKIEVITALDPEISEVRIDSEKMKQVVLNLLSNAVEFTREGGRIEVSTKIRCEDGKADRFVILIQDTGIGIGPATLDKIFDPYFTTKQRSDMHSGTGLGLFIAHQNMLAHGGTIEVQSKVGAGTAFTLTLPGDASDEVSGRDEGDGDAH
jgi:signal transduction histidine kinase